MSEQVEAIVPNYHNLYLCLVWTLTPPLVCVSFNSYLSFRLFIKKINGIK